LWKNCCDWMSRLRNITLGLSLLRRRGKCITILFRQHYPRSDIF
jgi:hypothetical protein